MPQAFERSVRASMTASDDDSLSIEERLERRAFDAWPAATVHDLDGWKLRYTSGVTRRANSVWPGALRGPLSLEERVARAERFYEERSAPSCFQIIPIDAAHGLDEDLARRGYDIDAPVWIQTAPIDVLASAWGPAHLTVRVAPGYDAAWLHVAVTRGRFRDAASVLTALLDRIGPSALFATALRDEEPIAIALGVLSAPFIGIFNMMTVPEHRREGAAGGLLLALARAADTRGIRHAYLQVERDNHAAMTLYARAGFTTRYGYHYRVRRP
jgi:GNAT superfamily N-acetyltransferase